MTIKKKKKNKYARGHMAFSVPILLSNQYTLFTIDKKLFIKKRTEEKNQ